MRYLQFFAAAAAMFEFLGGCAGNGAGLDASGQPVAAGGSGSGVLTAEFASIQQLVFSPVCTICHAGAGAPQGLRLDSTNSYALLVGVPSTEEPGVLRVRAGDPANSYLLQKLEGHAAVGAQMPFGGPPLPAATIAVIRQWITDGAQRGSITAGSGFSTTAVVPASGDVLSAAPANLVMEFSDALDRTRIDATSLRLVAVPDTGDAASGQDFAVALAVAAGNDRALIVTPLSPLAGGRYRLVVGAAPATGISSISGQRLEGSSGAQDVTATEFELAGPQ